MDKVQLKKKYEEKYFSKKTDFKQSQLDLKNYDKENVVRRIVCHQKRIKHSKKILIR